jgi:hypothetical protein
MRFIFSILLVVFTPYLILSQALLFVYAEGNISGSTYTRIELNGKYLGTIDIGENVICDLVNSNNNIIFKNRAYDDRKLVVSSNDNHVIVKVDFTRRGMTVRQVQLHEAQSNHRSLIAKYIEEKAEVAVDPKPSSKVFVDGDIPEEGNTILISIKPNENCTKVDLDVMADYLNASLMSKYKVVNREDLDLLLEEQKLSLSGLIQEEESVEAGNLIGANYTMLSSYQCVEKANINLTLKLINCETSEIEWVAILNDIKYSKIPEKVSELFSH